MPKLQKISARGKFFLFPSQSH